MSKKILVVDDEELIRWSLQKELSAEGYGVSLAGSHEQARKALESGSHDLVLCDLKLPDGSGLELLQRIKREYHDLPVIMITAYGEVANAVEAMKAGAADFITKPFQPGVLSISLQKVWKTGVLQRRIQDVQSRRKSRYNFESVVAVAPSMNETLREARKMCRSDASTILLEGESGTGKDLLARVIHYESGRAQGPFLEISCIAIPENLLESELFGYEKGAFTDARGRKSGLLERAEDGTAFLNEIGHMPLGLQGKILRAIEEKTFKRVGGTEDIQINARVIAATNQPLEAAVQSGSFRKDLFYRLNVLSLVIPPLRERREDILPLIRLFSSRFSVELKKPELIWQAGAQELLQEYDWPGNCRELRNLVERLMILSEEREVSAPDLVVHLKGGSRADKRPAQPAGVFTLPAEGVSLEELEKIMIRQALERTQGNQIQAAKLLGLSRHTLRYRMHKHGFLGPGNNAA